MKTVPSNENMPEQTIASAMLYQTASLVSKSLDTFASWLIAGFGAAVALLVTNHEARLVLPDYVIRDGAHWFLLAVSAAIIEKYLSVIITGAASGAETGAKLVTEYLDRHPEIERLNLQFIVLQVQQGTVWILRGLAARAHRRALAGDVVTSARRTAKLAQWQGLVVLVEIAFFLRAIYEVVTHLPS